ncbi:adhesion G-protein coupled receptor G7 [Pelobates fuscus]|uniref:adhesion G-protein coupled receptor G7 n=1 Tax=Pelobates fuscus TaxID=191477 RepID=UPI002FE4817C
MVVRWAFCGWESQRREAFPHWDSQGQDVVELSADPLQLYLLSSILTSACSHTQGLGEDDNLASNRIIVKENASELLVDKMAEVQIFVSSQSDSYNRGTVGFVLYQNGNFFRSKKHTPKISFRKRIISASLSSGTLGNIQFIFNPQHDPLYILQSYTCVFWDYKLSDWNTKGCSNVENDKGFLQCSCNHTTNFAVLMSFKKHSHYKALGIVSTVGCALSIAGLAITIVFQILQRKMEKQQTKWILLCLFISMLIFNIIFITGVENNQPNSTDIEKHPDEIPKTDLIEPPENRSCTAVAVLLHYFLLTTFLWTAVSAALMYRQLVQIKHMLPSHLTMYSIITAWGLPAVFVGITFGATYSVSPSHYRQEEFCWLATLNTAGHFDYGKPMFWSFLLPVGIILAMNGFIFVALMVKVTWKKEDETLRSTKKKVSLIKKISKTLSLSVLLGVTWVFGYLMLASDDTARDIFSFLFCACISTQGLQIFLFYTLDNKAFLEKVSAFLRLFNSCRIYLHSDRYFVNKVQTSSKWKEKERFRLFEDSTQGLFTNNNDANKG